MLNLRIINDVHVLGVEPYLNFDQLTHAILTSKYPVYLCGDIVDLVNCKNKDVNTAIKMVKTLSEMAEYISGNHDPIEKLLAKTKQEALIWDQILVTHGDEASWGVERSQKFRNKDFGAGWFKRNLISKPISNLRHLIEVRPNENHLAYVERKKRQYPLLKYIAMGHSHPPQTVTFDHVGVKCFILPQGVNDMGFEL